MIGLNWGNGFVTDKDLINSRGLSNPISFFEQAVTRPWAKKVSITALCGFSGRASSSKASVPDSWCAAANHALAAWMWFDRCASCSSQIPLITC
jgi:hypothetical protein